MTQNLVGLFALYYEECFDFYEDLRNGEDEGPLLYDKGAMNAMKHAIMQVCDDAEYDETKRLIEEVKETAQRDACRYNAMNTRAVVDRMVRMMEVTA